MADDGSLPGSSEVPDAADSSKMPTKEQTTPVYGLKPGDPLFFLKQQAISRILKERELIEREGALEEVKRKIDQLKRERFELERASEELMRQPVQVGRPLGKESHSHRTSVEGTQEKEIVVEWSLGLMNKLRSWLWVNDKATAFFSQCLRHKEQQDKLTDLLKWTMGCQNYSNDVQQYISGVLGKVVEFALMPVPYSLTSHLSEAINAISIPVAESKQVLNLISRTPAIGEPLVREMESTGHEGTSTIGEKKAKQMAPPTVMTQHKERTEISEVEEFSDDEELEEHVEVVGINDELASLLDSKGVPHYQVIHDPRKERHVEVVGVEVEALCDELSAVAREKDYTLSTKNKVVKLGPQGSPLLSNWIVSCGGIVPDPMFALCSKGEKVVTINAIMQATITRFRKSEEYFALTTAHAVMSEDQRKILDASTYEFENMFDEVESQFSSKRYHMAVKGGEGVDVISPVQWIYKYFVKRGDSSEWAALQDIAFVNLLRHQVDMDGLICSGHHDAIQAGQSSTGFQEAYVKKISSRGAAQALIGKRIMCRGKTGVLIDSSTTKTEDSKKHEHVMGVHLEFKFDDPNFILVPGDCGSLVYLADKVKDKLPIIGVFFGQLLEKTEVHCAVILHWNIKLAEKTDKLQLEKVKLATYSPEAEQDPSDEETENDSNKDKSSASGGPDYGYVSADM